MPIWYSNKPVSGGVEDASGISVPEIIFRSPAPGQLDVGNRDILTIQVFDQGRNLDDSTVELNINGAVVFDGSSFDTGYTGTTEFKAGIYTIQLFPNAEGWGYKNKVNVAITLEYPSPSEITDRWDFTVEANPVCYDGLSTLDIEKELKTPMSTYLDIEPLRQLFLNHALTDYNVDNALEKAIRVLYQAAFSTELSTLQNPYDIKDAAALKAVVCEKNSFIKLDRALLNRKADIQIAIQSLSTAGVFSSPYISAFSDYLDSTLYHFRVSLVANLVLATKAIEWQS